MEREGKRGRKREGRKREEEKRVKGSGRRGKRGGGGVGYRCGL
jgi:hypothetical protein